MIIEEPVICVKQPTYVNNIVLMANAIASLRSPAQFVAILTKKMDISVHSSSTRYYRRWFDLSAIVNVFIKEVCRKCVKEFNKKFQEIWYFSKWLKFFKALAMAITPVIYECGIKMLLKLRCNLSHKIINYMYKL